MHGTARRFCPSLRATLTLGYLALSTLSGCAPVDATEPHPGAEDVASTTLRLDPERDAAEGLRADRANPATIHTASAVEAPTRQDLRGPLLTADPVAPGTLSPTLDQAFDPGVFSQAVGRAMGAYVPGAAALPPVAVPTRDDAETAVTNLVRRSVNAPVTALTKDLLRCGDEGAEACSARFVRVVADLDERLAADLSPLVQQLRTVCPELRATLWHEARNGVVTPLAVTLHGRHLGALVGVVVFRGDPDATRPNRVSLPGARALLGP
ncbi:MAG: hypothetical protein U0325_05240 [Polyangiales bacterium]